MNRSITSVQGSSPIQRHRVLATNDVQWIEGLLTTLGNPTNYINQDGLDFLTIGEPRITPWVFTGLPASRPAEVIVARERLQFLVFPDDAAIEQFREAPRTETILVNLGLAVVRGKAPFLSEARLPNFLDFWKGLFFPITDARVHFLSSCVADLPQQARLLYVNRRMIQSYTSA